MQAADNIVALGLKLPRGIAPRGEDAAMLVRQLLMAAPRWELGAMGPRAFDCWSMHQLVQFHLFGRRVEAVRLDDKADLATIRAAVASHPANTQWAQHEGAPMHGEAVKMGHLHNPFHIGVYLGIDRGVILHHTEVSGVCCDSLTQLRARGYRKISFHRWVGGAQ